MTYSIKNLPKGLAEISFNVTPKEYEPYLLGAARELAEEKPLAGFRPGKAPYEIIKQRFGEVRILEAALPKIIKHYYKKVVAERGLETIDEPNVSVTKLAPGDTLEYKLAVALLPKASLNDWEKISVVASPDTVSAESVSRALQDLRKTQTKEATVNRPAAASDKVLVNMEMLQDNIAIEGGQATNHVIYLGEKYYLPGLAEKLIGARPGETREFDLDFPKEHYKKSLAGQSVRFKIKVLDVFELTLPELDDAFAATLGQKTLVDLRALIQKNLQAESSAREFQRQEVEIIDKIIAGSRFDDLPEVLINTEVNRMLAELERGVTEQGLEFNQYLEQIKKSVADLKLELTPEAIKRVKASLVVREIAKQKNISLSDEEVMTEVTRLINMYKNNPEMQKEINNEEYQENIRAYLKNRKTMELIRKTVIKQQ